MKTLSIDDTARFASMLSFELPGSEPQALAAHVQRALEERAAGLKGFIGSVVMINREKPELLVVSLWESSHAWSEAQYDRGVGLAVSEAVEAATSFKITPYETLTLVRA